MAKVSAGVLMWRRREGRVEVLLVHPGGPFWKRQDAGAWSIPKGEVEEGEGLEATARREFLEEMGSEVRGELTGLKAVRLKSGKWVHGFLVEGDFEVEGLKSNETEVEWPRGSGRKVRFAEVDRCGWFGLEEAKLKVNAALVAMVEEAAKEIENSK